MSFTTGTPDGGLWGRLDEIETRLEYLEAVVLDDTERAATPSKDGPEVPPAVVDEPEIAAMADVAAAPASEAEAPAATKDLRTLQREATADVPMVRPAITSAPAQPLIDLRDIEERLAGRALALVGGAALLLGAVFFLSLAFSRGWIGPEMQVALGLAGGSIGLVVGGLLLFRGERIVGHVLTAVGLAVISLSLFAATSLYGLAEPTTALAGVLLAATVATVIAVRGHSQVVAGFGLAAVLAAPPIMGAEPDLLTVAYMAVALAGIAAVSLWQTWPWLPPLAFVLSVPQLYQWIVTEPELASGVTALLGYWTVMTVAAAGEALRSTRRALSITSAPLFLLVGVTVTGLAFILLEADVQRAAFLLALAGLHGLVTIVFAARRGLLDPFGLLAGASGLTLASAAVPLLLEASASAMVWTAEAAALAFFAARRSHGPALISAAILFVLAGATLAYEALLLGPVAEAAELDPAAASVGGAVAGFGFLAAAAVGTMLAVPVRAWQSFLAGLLALVAVPLAHVLVEGAALVAVWMAIAVAAVAVPRLVRYLPERPIRWRLGPALGWIRPTQDPTPGVAVLSYGAATAAICASIATTVMLVVDQPRVPAVPFTDQAGLAALALAIGFVAIGFAAGGAASLRRSLFAAGLTIGVVSIIEIESPWYVLVWAALAVGAALMSRVEAGGVLSYRHMALGALGVLAVLALAEAPPQRLVVAFGGVPAHPLLVSEATLALAVLAAALAAAAAVGRRRWPKPLVTGLAATAGLAVLYLLSVGTVDVFAGQAHGLGVLGQERLDELIKEAQVALSVLWTAVGVIVLGAGLVLRQAELRFAGLAVLGLATVKVFLVDLSSLDVAYRVITLIVLGLLLIVSAYAWNRMKPGDAADRANRSPSADAAPHDSHARP